MRKITLTMIAQELNLTPSSVCRALSGKKGVSEETRRRVTATARQLGYLPGPTLERPAQVVVLIDEDTLHHSMFWSHVIKGLVMEVPLHKGFLSVAITNAASETLTLPSILEHVGKADGVIAIRKADIRAVQAVTRIGLPVVLVNYMTTMPGCDSVIIDDHGGTFTMASELIKLGHRRFGFTGDQKKLTFRRRYEGLTAAMIHAGIMDKFPDCWPDPADLPDRDLPTALFCSNDKIAARAVKILLERGLRIPEDISVVGFDDYTDETNVCPIPLTTLRVNREELGHQAVRTLFQRLNTPDCSPLQIAVGVAPVWRQSTGKHRD